MPTCLMGPACPKILTLHPRDHGTHPSLVAFEPHGFSLDLVPLRALRSASASSSWDPDFSSCIGSFAVERAIIVLFYFDPGDCHDSHLSKIGIHPDRAPGGDRHHWSSDLPIVAGGSEGPGSGQSSAML